jgi:FkbM family methyltransferase
MIREAEDPIEVVPTLWGDIRGNTGWDVGANTGQATRLLLGNGFKEVLAFEPCQESYDVLTRKSRGDSRVLTFRVAISDHIGELVLTEREVPVLSGQLVAASMSEQDHTPNPMVEMPWGRTTGQITVACSTIDWYLRQYGIPDFISVDTEGGEVDVLAGATEMLKHPHVQWLIETHSAENAEECRKILELHDFSYTIVRHPHYATSSPMYEAHTWLKTRRETPRRNRLARPESPTVSGPTPITS